MSQPTVIYSPGYDLQFFGLEKLHPFDGHKYSKAWRAAAQTLGPSLRQHTLPPTRPIATPELLTVHSAAYLAKLHGPAYVAQVLELSVLRYLPYFLLEQCVLRPMRLAVMGTWMAAQAALEDGLAINLGGGYHHASADRGEGFCCFADIHVALHLLRQAGKLVRGRDRVMIVDLDAHQGNGHERLSVGDGDVYIFDVYNRGIYPQDYVARRRIDYDVPLPAGSDEVVYLQQLHKHLPAALEAANHPALAFYIAGTDIYENDQLGGLGVSSEGIGARDRFVLNLFGQAGVPLVMVTGGGYSAASYQQIANTLIYAFGPGASAGSTVPRGKE